MGTTYSLYSYECGSLKIFGQHSSRAKHNTVEDAIVEYNGYVEKMKKINNGKDFLKDKQVLIIKYTDAWQSEIVGIIKNEEYKEI